MGTGGNAAATRWLVGPHEHRETTGINSLFVCAIVLMVVIAIGGAAIGMQASTGSRLARLTVGLVLMLVPIGSAMWLGGCSGGSSPPTTATYALTVTATVDGSAQTATLTLTVD